MNTKQESNHGIVVWTNYVCTGIVGRNVQLLPVTVRKLVETNWFFFSQIVQLQPLMMNVFTLLLKLKFSRLNVHFLSEKAISIAHFERRKEFWNLGNSWKKVVSLKYKWTYGMKQSKWVGKKVNLSHFNKYLIYIRTHGLSLSSITILSFLSVYLSSLRWDKILHLPETSSTFFHLFHPLLIICC